MAEVVGYSVEDNSDIEKSVIDAAKKHFSNGSYDSALKLYLGLLKTSASARLYFDVGLCYYKKNDYDKAIEYLSQAVNLDINNSAAYSYLGNCYFRKLDAKSAIENWSIARSITPTDEHVCQNLAIAYYAKGMTYESMYYNQKYLKYAQNKTSSQYQTLHKNMNTLYKAANEYYILAQKNRAAKDGINAEINYKNALKKYPIIPEYSVGLANLYYDWKNYADAVVFYEMALRENSSADKEIYFKIADSYEKTNDYRLAYCFYNRYIKYTLSNQREYLDITRKTAELRKQLDSSATDITREMAKQYYNNNEYYKSLIEYENCVILDKQHETDYDENIQKLRGFVNPESIVTQRFLAKGNELLLQGEQKSANKYFTEVMALTNPKSDVYKLAKSKIANVK